MSRILARSLYKLPQRSKLHTNALPKSCNEIAKQIRTRIKAAGPISVADYMKQVLIDPTGGYYMHKDVFGEGGDFVTSPELSQIFGEMIAVWFLNEWSKAGGPKPVQIVELGPGRGTLMQDILRVFAHFRLLDKTSVRLVEVSPYLCEMQYKRLAMPKELNEFANELREEKTIGNAYRSCVNINNVPISWYKDLSDVPNCFTLLVAHEFFDALPIYKFHKTDFGYREVFVDNDDTDELKFRFTVAPSETPTQVFIKHTETRPHLEISPQSLSLTQQIAKRLEVYGGLALIADYGHNGNGTDTFRSFRNHKLHDPLSEPGTADLTADVDFAALKEAASTSQVLVYGPISQREFLLNMGMEHRVKLLKQGASKEQVESLDYSYKMMTEPDQMGERFKFMAFLPATLKVILDKYPVTGFNRLL